MVKEAFGGLGGVELVIILVIVLLIFGAGKLPQIGGAIGKSISAFKNASSGKDGDTVDVTPADAPGKPDRLAEVADSKLPPREVEVDVEVDSLSTEESG
jgi:sec-independent protein translocase protein TatA